MVKKLDNKEKAFVSEYLIDLDTERAAIKAGYSKTMAKTKAYGWVSNSKTNTKPHVYDAILKKMKAKKERNKVDADMIIQELMRIGFGDIRNIVNWNGDVALLKNSADLTQDDMAMVAGVVQKKGKYGDTVEIKFNDKLAALDKLARHVGLYKDFMEVKKTVAISDEDKAILERLGIKADD